MRPRAPGLSLAILCGWLVLNPPPTSAGTWCIGALLALGAPRLVRPLVAPRPRLRRPWLLAALLARTYLEVPGQSLRLLAGIVAPRRRPLRAQFVFVPIALTDPYALATLQWMTSTVPGTIWCEWQAHEARLLLHVADVPDVQAFIAHYRHRYETPLQRIFG